MDLTGTIHWGTLSQNSDIFLFLKLGIFSLILEKNILFCNWEHDSKLVFKMCQRILLVYQKYQENNYICITIHTLDRFTLQDKECSGPSFC